MRFDDDRMAQSPPKGAIRLIFEYEGDQIRLISQQEVDAAVPEGDATSDFQHESGFWLEVRSADNNVLHRRIMQDPTSSFPEVFAEEGKTITRAETPIKKGAFTIIVPNIATSDHVAFIRSGPRAGIEALTETTAPMREIARFSLKSKTENMRGNRQ